MCVCVCVWTKQLVCLFLMMDWTTIAFFFLLIGIDKQLLVERCDPEAELCRHCSASSTLSPALQVAQLFRTGKTQPTGHVQTRLLITSQTPDTLWPPVQWHQNSKVYSRRPTVVHNLLRLFSIIHKVRSLIILILKTCCWPFHFVVHLLKKRNKFKMLLQ